MKLPDKIVDYTVTEGDSVITLACRVNELIDKGWRPHGSLAVETRRVGLFSFHTVLLQPLVKFEPQAPL